VVIAKSIFSDSAGLSAAAGAFLGHLYPVWLRFRGGKGVATYVGGLLGAFWPGALAFAVVWLGIAYGTRYSSAAALGGSLIAPVVALQMGETRVAEVFFALACLLWLRHSQNIQRLFLGQETKIGAEKAG
jgi:glycerol-3-phosphate acyltransferase PlsY